MKRINNRQKLVVKPRESVQKYLAGSAKVQKEAGRSKLPSRLSPKGNPPRMRS